jgi:hypothetical protein
MNSKTEITIQVPLEIARYYAKINPDDRVNIENKTCDRPFIQS